MKISPRLEAVRFAQVAVGSFFLSINGPSKYVAIKVRHDGDNDYLVPLGPNFPNSDTAPKLYSAAPSTVINLGSEVRLELSLDPSSWTTTEPGEEIPAIAIAEETPTDSARGSRTFADATKAFLRIATTDGWNPKKFVDMTNGTVVPRISTVSAWTTDWDVWVPDSDDRSKSLLTMRGRT